MATILPMPAPRSKTTPSADMHEGATILFFTGIRYMRDDDSTYDDAESDPDRVEVLSDPPDNSVLALI